MFNLVTPFDYGVNIVELKPAVVSPEEAALRDTHLRAVADALANTQRKSA